MRRLTPRPPLFLDDLIQAIASFRVGKRSRRHRRPTQGFPAERLESRQLLTVTFETLADLNTTPDNSFYPDQFAFGSDVTYFVASQPTTGRELWRTDGTANGAHIVKDIAPGPASSTIGSLTTVGDVAWFIAEPGNFLPQQLWRSDGTEGGTMAVTWANGQPVLNVQSPISFNNEIYFQATRPLGYGPGYFHVANTSGAVPLEITLSGPLETFSISPTSVVVGQSLYLQGLFGDLQVLEAGDDATTLLIDSVDANFITNTGTKLLFSGRLPTGNYGSWITDGTPVGTHPISLPEGIDWNSIAPLGAGGFRFLATDASEVWSVWTSDGTTEGTHIELQVPDAPRLYTYRNSVGLSDGIIYFVTEPVNSIYELWRTDGTLDGTKPLTDPQGIRLTTYPLSRFRNGIVFQGSVPDEFYRRQSWFQLDTTADRITEIPLGDSSSASNEGPLAIGPEQIYVRLGNFSGIDTYFTDGTQPFSRLTNQNHSTLSIDPANFVAGPNRLLALATSYDGPTPLVLQSDGTSGNTTFTNLYSSRLMMTSQDVGFGVNDYSGELQVLLPSSSTWQSLKSIAPSAETRNATLLAVQGNRLFYSASGLWITDGTAAGTKAILDHGAQINDAIEFAPFGENQIIFTRTRSNGSTEIWATDGTGGGTKFVRSLGSYSYSRANNFFHSFGTQALFFDRKPGQLPQLFSTDGTSEGTVPIFTITDGSIKLLSGGDSTFYFRFDKGGYSELWKKDGTVTGTFKISNITASNRITDSIVIDDRLYFATASGLSVTDGSLWTSDGRKTGTLPLLNGVANGRTENDVVLFSEFGQLFFLADDHQSGRRLWTSNGTAYGTKQVLMADGSYPPFMVPGYSSDSVKAMIGFKGALYYPGVTNEFGNEIVRLTSDTVEGSPGQLKLDDSSTPTLSWRAAFGADAYELQVINLDSADKQKTAFTSITTDWVLPEDYRTGSFRVWIRGVKNDGSTGRWSTQVFDFTLGSRPVLHSSPGLTTSTTPTISWANPAGTTKTEVWVGDRDRNIRVAYSVKSGVRSTFTPQALPPSQYAVWVRTYGSYGVSDWSSVGVFTVLSAAPAAVTVSVDAAKRMTIQWDAVPDATDYEIQVNLSGASQPFLKRSNIGAVTSFRLPQPVAGGQYLVWIRALRPGRVQSSWSNVSALFVRETPTLRVAMPDIRWKAINQASGYQIEVLNRRTNIVVLAATRTETVVHLDSLLPPDVYSVRIRTRYADGTTSEWSVSTEFEIFHASVVIQPKPQPSVDATPTISWTPQVGASDYEITVSRVGASSPSYQQKLLQGSSHRISTPLPPGNYLVWIRSHYSDNSRSLWGTGTPLSIGSPPVVSFAGNTVQWNAVRGATRYEVIIRYEDPATGQYSDYLRTNNFFETSISMASASPGKYRAWVRAIRDEAGLTYSSAWSQNLLFSIL